MTVPLKLRAQSTPKSVVRIATEAAPHSPPILLVWYDRSQSLKTPLRANTDRSLSLSDNCNWTLASGRTRTTTRLRQPHRNDGGGWSEPL